MRWRDGLWVRPLLGEPRAALRAHAGAAGLAWIEAPSNPTSLRGRIRALMPALDTLHGGAGAALARTARLLAQDAALIDELADAAWRRCALAGGLDLRGLRAEPPALQARLLRRLLADVPGVVRADHVEAALRWIPLPQGRLGMPAGYGLFARDGLLRVEAP
jgi:tRNA(Ile)-lysidine synthase